MRVVAIIPARYGSSRLPGKALAEIAGRPLIQHVVERTAQAGRVSEVWVATDDPRIVAAVRGFGGQVVLTSSAHRTGTDRIAEAARGLEADLMVNVQGDELLMDPRIIDQAVEPLMERRDLVMGTVAREIRRVEDLYNPAVVKVVVDQQRFALYFSRSPIPFVRDVSEEERQRPEMLSRGAGHFLEHIGLYVYRPDFLQTFAAMAQTPLERLESLEQLRALENGYRIAVAETTYLSLKVDTSEDLGRVRERADLGDGCVVTTDPLPVLGREDTIERGT